MACAPILLALRDLLPDLAARVAPRNADVRLVVFLLDWGAERWSAGLGGFWDAPFFFPTPSTMTLSEHLLLPSALVALLRAAGSTTVAGYNLLLVASFALTAAAVYALLRGAVRARPWWLAILALAVVHAPWRWGQLPHLQMLWAPGPPLAMLLFDRLLRRPRRGRASAFLLAYAITVLSGGYLAYFTHAALLTTVLLRCARRADRHRWAARWKPLVATLLLGASLTVSIYQPYLAASRQLRLSRRATEVEALGVRSADWLSPSILNRYSGPALRSWWRPEGDLFPGFLLGFGTVVGLAGLALGPRRGRRCAHLSVLGRALVVSGAALAVLENGPVFAGVAKVLPGLAGLRAPTRLHFFVLLAAAVLTGRALATVRRRSGSRWAPRITGLAALLLLVPEVWVRPLPRSDGLEPERAGQLPAHVRWLGSHPVRAVAHLPFVDAHVEAARMWRTRFHCRPIANGYSGYLARSFLYFRHECRAPLGAVSARCLDALEALGVSHLVVEDASRGLEPGDLRGRLAAALRRDARSRLTLEFADDEALVLALRASDARTLRSTTPQHQEQDRAGDEPGQVGVPGDAARGRARGRQERTGELEREPAGDEEEGAATQGQDEAADGEHSGQAGAREEHQEGAEHAGDGARGADQRQRRARRGSDLGQRRGQPREQVESQEARARQPALDVVTEHEQEGEIAEQVDPARVQEERGEEPERQRERLGERDYLGRRDRHARERGAGAGTERELPGEGRGVGGGEPPGRQWRPPALLRVADRDQARRPERSATRWMRSRLVSGRSWIG